LRLLDQLDDLLGLLRRDPLLQENPLLDQLPTRGLLLFAHERVGGDPPLDEASEEDLPEGLHLLLAVRLDEDALLVGREFDLGWHALEIPPRRHFFPGLVDRVVDLLQVHLRDDVERRHLRLLGFDDQGENDGFSTEGAPAGAANGEPNLLLQYRAAAPAPRQFAQRAHDRPTVLPLHAGVKAATAARAKLPRLAGPPGP